jgi:predicted GIY-YIG superfamily endonuclease
VTDSEMDEWSFEPHLLYRIYDGFDRPLYFGETNNLARRLAEHQEKAWFRRPDITIKLTMFPNRAEALAAESHAIAAEKPWYNKAGLKPSKEAAPRREPKKKAAAVIAPKPAPAKPKAIEPRMMLADLAAVLDTERVRISALPNLLRQLAPDPDTYARLSGAQLRKLLTAEGVRTTNAKNVPMLDPADLRSVLL